MSINTKTKGRMKRSDVSAEVISELNLGIRESQTLVEFLAMDFELLFKNNFPKITLSSNIEPNLIKGITKKMKFFGSLLHEKLSDQDLQDLLKHKSDIIRGWISYAYATNTNLSLDELLQKIRPLADDSNSGVREWAWIALRPHIASQLNQALDLLQPWILESSQNLRRFASEITRPRGVWCAHIQELKENPNIGLPIIETLKSDPSRYVQNSVANWLNDASKTRSDWVIDLCKKWECESKTKETIYICKRALRTIKQK